MNAISLPQKDSAKWRDLLEGRIIHNFDFVVAGLCVTRNVRELKRNHTEENYNKALDEIYTLFQKYEKLLRNDIAGIFK